MSHNYLSASVIITCYTEGYLLLEAVQSVREQSVLPEEIIIVNDGSPDHTTNSICHELANSSDIKVVLISQNSGPSVARNKGFESAKGEILISLDADDLLPPQAIEHIQAAFAKYPDADFIYGSYLRFDSIKQCYKVISQPLLLKDMLKAKHCSLSSNWSLIGTAPLRKRLWESLGGIDANFGASDLHDLEFWLRAMAMPCKHHATPEVIYLWRKYLGTNSRRVTPLSWYQIVQKHFDIYQNLGLEYRAYELLLLGHKWLGNHAEIKVFRKKLWQCIRQGHYQLSSLIVLAIPTQLFKILAKQAGRYR